MTKLEAIALLFTSVIMYPLMILIFKKLSEEEEE